MDKLVLARREAPSVCQYWKMEKEIVNKVALSGIITINLEEFYPQGERVLFDIKEHLFQGLILKEKDFREFVKNEDWSKYTDKYVAFICSIRCCCSNLGIYAIGNTVRALCKKGYVR